MADNDEEIGEVLASQEAIMPMLATTAGLCTMVSMDLYEQQNFALFMQQQNALAASSHYSALTTSIPNPSVCSSILA